MAQKIPLKEVIEFVRDVIIQNDERKNFKSVIDVPQVSFINSLILYFRFDDGVNIEIFFALLFNYFNDTLIIAPQLNNHIRVAQNHFLVHAAFLMVVESTSARSVHTPAISLTAFFTLTGFLLPIFFKSSCFFLAAFRSLISEALLL